MKEEHKNVATIPPQRSIVLASASPRRKELLQHLGLTFAIQPSQKEEVIQPDWSPKVVVQELALQKALDVAASVETGIVIGADTVVVDGDLILGKPKDEDEAISMLLRLQGKVHTVFSGVALIDVDHNKQKVGSQATKVKMKPLSDDQIRAYVSTGEPMDKAGAYAIQGLGATLVEEIEGDYFTVVGLPLSLTSSFLLWAGIDLLKLALRERKHH